MASFINLGVWFEYKRLITRDQEPEDEEVVPKSVQVKWLGYYLVLIAALLALMFTQIPYLPKQLHPQPEAEQTEMIKTE
ncbi:hypothetical protein IPM19_04740 [bacterium]|nr:MAG: hypothetical protein IPM19_04740 [bacterium]